MRKLSALTANPHNARVHPPEQIEHIRASIREFGFTIPVLVDEMGILLAGHARVIAAGMDGAEEVPCIVARGWSEAKKRAYIEADNRLSALGQWDADKRKAELAFLAEEGFNLAAIGWESDDLAKFLGTAEPEPERDPDMVGVLPTNPIVRPGEVWELGAHRLICGDSTAKDTWRKLMGVERANLVFTDPPYGVSYQQSSGEFGVIEGDHKRRDDLFKMLVGAFQRLAEITVPTAGFYIWHASSTRRDFEEALDAAGLQEKQYLIWAKPSLVLGRADYHWAHEPAFYCSHAGQTPDFYGDRAQQTVWRLEMVRTDQAATVIGPGVLLLDGNGQSLFVKGKAPKSKKLREVRLTDQRPRVLLSDSTGTGTVWEIARDHDYVHPTQKPTELVVRAIENSSKHGDIVADAFSGSASTIIACEMTGRRARSSELDPAYVQAGIERWQRFTGKKATLDGETFEAVAAARAGAPERRRRSAR
jgi:DNA modification methylase